MDDDCDIGKVCTDGECEAIGCPAVWDPVCGVDGMTYGNRCEARVAHVDVAYEGECEDEDERCRDNDDCPREEICHPETERCQPPCEIDCLRYDPVCGDDGNTYGCGEVDAHCHGAEVLYEGECRACGSSEECERGETCVREGYCLPDPDCPECDVCLGLCVP